MSISSINLVILKFILFFIQFFRHLAKIISWFWFRFEFIFLRLRSLWNDYLSPYPDSVRFFLLRKNLCSEPIWPVFTLENYLFLKVNEFLKLLKVLNFVQYFHLTVLLVLSSKKLKFHMYFSCFSHLFGRFYLLNIAKSLLLSYFLFLQRLHPNSIKYPFSI